MISDEIKVRVANALEIPALMAGVRLLNNAKESVWVETTWIIKIHFYQMNGLVSVVAATAQTQAWRRSLILLQEYNEHGEVRDVTFETKRSWIQLSGKDQRLIHALKNIDMHTAKPSMALDATTYSFDFEFTNRFSRVMLETGMIQYGENASYERLWSAIRASIFEIANAYPDKSIKKTIENYLALP
jgi:hypothetical protein